MDIKSIIHTFYDFLQLYKENIKDWSMDSWIDYEKMNKYNLLKYAVLNGDIQSVEYILNIAKPTRYEIDDVLTDLISPLNTMSLTVKKIMVSFLENYLIESMDVIESNFYGVGDCASFRVGDIVECINDREFKTLLRLANNILNNIQNHELTKILNIELDKRHKALNNVALLIVDILPDNKISTVILTDVIYKKYKQKRSAFKTQYNNNEYRLNEHELETNQPLLKYIKFLQNSQHKYRNYGQPADFLEILCSSIRHFQPMSIKNISTFNNQLLTTTNLFISFSSHAPNTGTLPPISLNGNEYVIMDCNPDTPHISILMYIRLLSMYAHILYDKPPIIDIDFLKGQLFDPDTDLCIFTKKVPNIELYFPRPRNFPQDAPNAVFQYPVKYNTIVSPFLGDSNLNYEKTVANARESVFKSDWGNHSTYLLDILVFIRSTNPNGFILIVSAN